MAGADKMDGLSNWSAAVTLSQGLNTLAVVGLGRDGNPRPPRDVGDYRATNFVSYY